MQLNIFYNGTDSNYEKDFKKEGRFIHGEIVSRLGFYAQKKNQSHVLRIHGVGSSKDDGDFATNQSGTAFGVRMRDDIQDIVKFVIQARQEQITASAENQNEKQLCVTLTGWSRGGIGCIYAAHMISKVWDQIEATEKSGIELDIRIIAFEPVSGLGTNIRALDLSWTKTALMGLLVGLSTDKTQAITASLDKILSNLTKWWELPKHVTEFHGFYAHDERSIGFAATMPTMLGDIKNRTFKLYETPGTHSTLVGNLYPNGGAKGNNTPDPVGLHIYRSVIQKALSLLNDWEAQFDESIYSDWLKPLGFNDNFQLNKIEEAPTTDQLNTYKQEAQKTAIDWFLKSHDIPLLTDGRGIYIGGNKQDRKWQSESSLTEFLDEKNTKSVVDSLWQYLTGSETKLNKLGGNVSAYNYNLTKAGWAV